jgi:hypothetical protein
MESRNICTAMGLDRQVVSCCFMWFTANLVMTYLLCKQLAGAADESTHMHTARYATDDNMEVLFLCTDLQLPDLKVKTFWTTVKILRSMRTKKWKKLLRRTG